MEYIYKEVRASKKSASLLEYARELESCCKNNMQCMEQFMSFTEKCDMEEASRYLRNGIREMEKSMMWLKAAYSYLEHF